MKALKVVLLFFLFSVSVQAKGWMVAVDYNIAVPGRQMQPYIKSTSLLGFGLDARKLVSPHISLGLSIGHQVFYWKTGETATLENGFFGTTRYRFLNTLPLMLNSHYYFRLLNNVEPYLGINVGGYYGWQRSEMGIVVKEDRTWRWGLAPEAGVCLPVGSMRMNIGTKLSYLGLPGEARLGDPRNQLFMSFYIGLSFFDFQWR